MTDTIELTIPGVEAVKIKEESQKSKVSPVLLNGNGKRNWIEKLVIPLAVAVAATITIFFFNNMTTKSLAEISRVEQKVDDFILREQEHFDILNDKIAGNFDILLSEIRILRLK